MRPSLLFISHRLPFPPHNGAAIRTFNVLSLLARHYDVTALCFDRRDSATAAWAMADRLRGLERFGKFHVFPIPQELQLGRLLWDHARSVVTRRAYTYFVHESREFAATLAALLAATTFDLVHVDSLDLVRQLDGLPPDRIILTHHNVESTLLLRRARAERSRLRRRYVAMQGRLLRDEERRWVPRVALNVTVSDADRRELDALAPGGRYHVVPNGVDVEYFRPTDRDRAGIVFVGGTSYYPNLDAIRWFSSDILPELRRLGCQSMATFVGRATPSEIEHFNAMPGMHLTGYVDDVRPYLDQAACFIAPLRVGGGTRLKLVDAWAMGKAVVSTSLGAEGLAVDEGNNIMLRDDPSTFAAAVLRLLTDGRMRERLERGARRTAEQIYDWNVIEAGMIEAYERVRTSGTRSLLRSAP